MFVQLNAIVVDADPENRSEMSAFLTQRGVHVTQQLPSVENLPNILQRSDAAQLVVVNLDPNVSEILKRMGHLPRQSPAISFFVLSQLLDANILMDAMHLGVKEFIPLPIHVEKFSAAIERIAGNYGMGKKAKIIHV